MNSQPTLQTEPYDPLIQKDRRPKRKRKDKKDDTIIVGGITIEKRPIVFKFD